VNHVGIDTAVKLCIGEHPLTSRPAIISEKS
jgi:hypothetical protein